MLKDAQVYPQKASATVHVLRRPKLHNGSPKSSFRVELESGRPSEGAFIGGATGTSATSCALFAGTEFYPVIPLGQEVFGVEFDNPVGAGTGKYKEVRFFYAKPLHASFIPFDALTKVDEVENCEADSGPAHKECVVCCENLTVPKLLPCAHLLCRGCLIRWMQTQPDAECPLCRGQIASPEERARKTVEDIVDGFPTDRGMAALVEAEETLSTQRMCNVCTSVAAASVCVTCRDRMCTSCAAIHGKLSATRDHVVEDLSSLSAEQLAAKSTAACAVHKSKPADLYCRTHDVYICLRCFMSSHRECSQVRSLGDQKEENLKLISELTAELRAGDARLMQTVAQLDDILHDIERHEEDAVALIEDKCDRLERALQTCRSRLKQQVAGACSGPKREVIDEKTSLLRGRGKLVSHNQALARARVFSGLDRDDVRGLTRTVQLCLEGLDQAQELSAHQPSPHFTIAEHVLTNIEDVISRLQLTKEACCCERANCDATSTIV